MDESVFNFAVLYFPVLSLSFFSQHLGGQFGDDLMDFLKVKVDLNLINIGGTLNLINYLAQCMVRDLLFVKVLPESQRHHFRQSGQILYCTCLYYFGPRQLKKVGYVLGVQSFNGQKSPDGDV